MADYKNNRAVITRLLPRKKRLASTDARQSHDPPSFSRLVVGELPGSDEKFRDGHGNARIPLHRKLLGEKLPAACRRQLLDQLYPEIALSPVTLGNRWTFVAVEEFQSSPSYEGNPMRPLVEPPPSSRSAVAS